MHTIGIQKRTEKRKETSKQDNYQKNLPVQSRLPKKSSNV